jgi:hypothetical protein
MICAVSIRPGCSGSTRCRSTRAPRPWPRGRCAPGRAWPRCGGGGGAPPAPPRGRPSVPGRAAAGPTAPEVTEALDTQLHLLRHQLLDAARHLTGAKVLAARLYGAGPVTGLALTCWLTGKVRFSSSRQPVRLAGLDITVHSSDRTGPPGRLSRQGPPVLRGAVCEAGKTHAGPRPRTTGTTPPSRTARTASAPPCPRPARSSGRPATS